MKFTARYSELMTEGALIIIMIIRNLYSAIMPLGGYRGVDIIYRMCMTHIATLRVRH